MLRPCGLFPLDAGLRPGQKNPMRSPILCLAALLAAIVPVCTSAQTATGGPQGDLRPVLTVERLFADPALNGPTLRAPALSPDGRMATWLQRASDDFLRFDLWAAPVTGGEPRMLVDSRALAPDEGALSPEEIARRERQRIAGTRGIVDYAWDEAGEAILVPLGGDLYHVRVADPAHPRRLTRTEAFETDARISPRGGHVSFIRDGALWAQALATGVETRLSPEAGGTVTHGMAEFVAQEEMDRDTGYWWSPDDSRVAFATVDEAPVAIIPRLEVGATSAEIVQQRYPRAGAANASVRLSVRHMDNGRIVAVDLGAPDGDVYVARVDWSKDGRTLYVQRPNRTQTRLDILMVDPDTGASRVIVTETDPAWINLSHDFHALADGSFLWTSERSGWRHIERRDRDGANPRVLTAGPWAVRAVEGVDEAGGRVYFTSNRADPLAMQLWSVPLAPGPRGRLVEPVQVTSGPGTWSVRMAGAGGSFIGTYQAPDTPPRASLHRGDGTQVRWLLENPLVEGHPWAGLRRGEIRYGTLQGPSGDTLHWSITLPPDFDLTRRWPVIQYVYGGPGVQVVTRGWGSNVDQMQAARGYIVFRLDNRGTPNRGRDFERALHLNLGTIEMEDQAAGLAWLRTQSFVDPERVGVWGWSYGGYMALRLATNLPEAWNAYVAGAPVTDWALYDTYYTERYMGLPQDQPEAYVRSAVLPDLPQVRRPLLILHGMADDNVTFDNATAAFDILQQAGIPFEAMVYPGQRHGIPDKARSVHVQRTITGFFDRHMGPGPAPPERRED